MSRAQGLTQREQRIDTGIVILAAQSVGSDTEEKSHGKWWSMRFPWMCKRGHTGKETVRVYVLVMGMRQGVPYFDQGVAKRRGLGVYSP